MTALVWPTKPHWHGYTTVIIADTCSSNPNIACQRQFLTLCGRECQRVNGNRVERQTLPLNASRVFMLTHGKEVRKVSFLLDALKALPVTVFRGFDKVSFSVRYGYFLTFKTVKYSIYLFL